MTARDSYPNIALWETCASNSSTREQYTAALDEIDRLRLELERSEQINDRLRRTADANAADLARYRTIIRNKR